MGMGDWTRDDFGRSNSSAEFVALANEVGRLIRDSAYDIVRGDTNGVGRLIMAQLAHRYGLAPISPTCAPHNHAANASPSCTPSKPSAPRETTTHAPKSKP